MTRIVAFYLPQFYPIPENDEWWGKGFTEWRNVVSARPLFDGHYQPHIPADLGFYDLRVPETRQAQADLARRYGISAFCYYHYWFMGRRLLERPFEEVLGSGNPDFPFLLCWANHTWTRLWDGTSNAMLMDQKYSSDDDVAHINSLIPAFRDRRYFRVDEKPMFLVYSPMSLPNPKKTSEVWREIVARKRGVRELHLVAISRGPHEPNPRDIGFDAALIWKPSFYGLDSIQRIIPGMRAFDYSRVIEMRRNEEPIGDAYETALITFDNSPRRKENPVIFHGSTPEIYGVEIKRIVRNVQRLPEDRRVVFIFAWNEWGEGAHLEPDLKWGMKYLEETKAALEINGNSKRT